MQQKPILRLLACLLCMGLLAGLAPVPGVHAAEPDSNLLIAFTHADLQANKNSFNNSSYGGNSTVISGQQISGVYLAKNEYEGFQIYVAENNAEETGVGHRVRVELDAFLDAENHVLPHLVYKEMYLGAAGVITDPLAEVLIPYDGAWIDNGPGENQMFYVDLRSAPDQPAGDYRTEIRVYIDDEEEPYLRQSFTATVWNFALPEGHYSSVLAGLHNTASGYGATRGFLEGCGVQIAGDGTPVQTPENLALAEAVLEGWDELMLDHGFNPYELPRWLIDKDPKAAQLAMADVRRQYAAIPILSYSVSNGSLTPAAAEKIAQYRELVKGSEFLQAKSFFYSKDEAGWTADEQADSYRALVAALRNVWTEGDSNGLPFHNLVTYNGAGDYDVCMNVFKQTADILVFAQEMFRTTQTAEQIQRNRGDYLDYNWYRALRYTTGIEAGSARLWRWKKGLTGLWRRIYFWQQAILEDDGILTWNSAWFSYPGGSLYNVWETGTLPPRNGAQGDNGDGILLYPAGQYNAYFGLSGAEALDVTKPLMSLRFKQLSAGLDDYDYVKLAKEVLGEEEVQALYVQNMVMDTLRETGQFANMWPDVIDWAMGPGKRTMYTWRQAFGEALDSAVGGAEIHSFGDWVTVVEPDQDHEGLKIRSCAACGTQESCAIPRLGPVVLPFEDVPEDAWYREAVAWGWSHSPRLTNGVSDDRFAPDSPCTRAQIATLLWRWQNVPEVGGTLPFADVPEGSWYTEAVRWAWQQGYVVGTAPDCFSPTRPCTRAELLTILWRFCGAPGSAGELPFDDVPEGSWYADAVRWAWEQGITRGVSAQSFGPLQPCTRAQSLVLLWRTVQRLGLGA